MKNSTCQSNQKGNYFMSMLHRSLLCFIVILLNAVTGAAAGQNSGDLVIRGWKVYLDNDLMKSGGYCRGKDGEWQIRVPSDGSKGSIQLWGEVVLAPEKNYEVTFAVEAQNPGEISFTYKHHPDYYSRVVQVVIPAGKSVVTQKLSINKITITPPGVIHFYLGKINGTARISNIKIKEEKEVARKMMFGDYFPPYTRLKRDPMEKDTYGGIDFWKDDRLNVPNYDECRNMLSNPSFEAGLRYYTFPSSIGTYQPGYEDKYTIDTAEGKFGRASLKIRTECPAHPFDCIQSFAYPVDKGVSYTLSFYAKTNNPGTLLEVAHVSANSFAKEQQPNILALSALQLSKSWERYAIPFKSNSTGYGFSFKILKNVKDGAVWIDGLQLEKGGSATEFTEKPVCVVLSTSAEGNFLTPEEKINAKLRLNTDRPNSRGTVTVTVKDFFYNIVDLGKFSFKTNSDGCADVSLPVDEFYKGKKGVFVVKTVTDVGDSKNNIEYSRFAVMDKMHGKHRNKDIFSYHQLVIPNYEKGLARWRDIGLGSTNYFYYNFHDKQIFDLLKKYDIDDTCALLRQHWDSSLKPRTNYGTGNTISIQKNGAADGKPDVLVQGMREWESVSPEQAKAVEAAAEKYARYYYWRKKFAFHQEMGGYKILDNGQFDDVARLLIACAKGVKKASPDNLAFTEGGAGNIMAATSLIDNLLTAAEKIDPGFKFDRFAAHAYGHPENEEFDDLLKSFFSMLDRHGYTKAPIYINEGGYYSPFCIAEWGLTPYRPFLMDHYQLWAISYDMGWGERISATLTIRAWLLALKYQDRIKQFNMWRPFIYQDCDLTPMAVQKAANTLARLLGNASFKKEIVFAARSKAYVFEDADRMPIAAIWGYEEQIEQGYMAPLLMEIKSNGAVTEVLDLMENSYNVPANQQMIELPLSPFPIFLKGRQGETGKLIEIVRNISVQGEKTPPIQVIPKLKNKDTLLLEIKNLLTREFSGEMTVISGADTKQCEIKISGCEKFLMDVKLPHPAVDSQINTDNILWTIKTQNGNHYADRVMLDLFSVKKASRTISMTGNLSEWDDIPYIQIRNTKPIQKTPYKDFEAKFKTAWDDKYFYLLVDVTDDKLFYDAPIRNSAEATTCDVMLVYFDTLCNGKEKNTLRVDSDDYYYVFMPRPDDGIAKVWVQEACNQQLSIGVEAVKAGTFNTDIKTCFRKTDKGYFYEIAFPQLAVLPLQLKAGSVFGFGLFILDKDDKKSPEKALTLSSSPGSCCWRSAHLWPQAMLKSREK